MATSAAIAAGPVILFGMMPVVEVDERDRHERDDEQQPEDDARCVVLACATTATQSAPVAASTSG